MKANDLLRFIQMYISQHGENSDVKVGAMVQGTYVHADIVSAYPGSPDNGSEKEYDCINIGDIDNLQKRKI